MSTSAIQIQTQDLRAQLLQHPMYQALQSLEDLQNFTELHVFAVWDFMSLTKALQIHFTCVSLPWQPSGSPSLRRFINEIVWGEESDLDQHGQAISHYELYLRAMQELGANTQTIEAFRLGLSTGAVLPQLPQAQIPQAAKNFLQQTFAFIEQGKIHQIAAAFTYGREDLIPDLFHRLVARLADQHPERFQTFRYYLERHIEVDGDSHGPLALQLMNEVCGDDAQKWSEAAQAAQLALQARLELWNAIQAKVQSLQEV